MPIPPLPPEVNILIWIAIIGIALYLIFKHQKSNEVENPETKKIMEELLDEIKSLRREIKKLREELSE